MNIGLHPRRDAGFSLLEVLIAVVILSFGLLALAALQGALFKSSAEAKAQSVALGLAQEKLEYFRGFKTMTDYQAITDSGAAEAITVGGVAYSRTWSVNRCAYPKAGGGIFTCGLTLTGALPATYATNNEFKRVLVNVTWIDASNATQRVSLEDAIAALDPADSAKLGKLTSGTTPRGPEVRIYNPAMQQQGVIPIAVGNGSDTAATNPKPLVNSGNVIETRFDVLTYNQQSGNTAVAQSRIETSIMGCSCDYGNPVSGGMRPTYWDGSRYSSPETAASIVPSYTAVAGPDDSVSGQSDLCTICCRDHHDPSNLPTGVAKFDPRNAAHKNGHYLLNTTTGALTGPFTSGKYTESCRVIRVDGLFRVAADTYEEYHDFLATKNDGSTTAYLPTAAATTNYQNFVKAYLDQRVVTQSTQSAWNDVLSVTAPGSVSTLESTNSVYTTQPTAITFNVADAAKWLHLRGLYVDYLEDKALQAVKDAKTNCKSSGGGSPSTSDLEGCVLPILPFTSINMTELGIYAPLSASSIVVANNNFADTLTSTAPVRGKVSRVTGATPGTVNATSKLLRSNSGLTSWSGFTGKLIAIDAEDATNSIPQTWTATQPYNIQGSGGGGSTESFTINLYAPAAGTAYPFTSNNTTPYINSDLAGLTCNYIGQTSPNYTCTPTGSLGGANQTLTVGNYNFQINQAKTATASTISCSGFKQDGTATTLYLPAGTTYTSKTCRNYGVASVTSTNAGASPQGPVASFSSDTLKAETTKFSPIPVSNGDVVSVIFGTPVDTPQATTCTFTCTQYQGGLCKSNKTTYTVTSNDCP